MLLNLISIFFFLISVLNLATRGGRSWVSNIICRIPWLMTRLALSSDHTSHPSSPLSFFILCLQGTSVPSYIQIFLYMLYQFHLCMNVSLVSVTEMSNLKETSLFTISRSKDPNHSIHGLMLDSLNSSFPTSCRATTSEARITTWHFIGISCRRLARCLPTK